MIDIGFNNLAQIRVKIGMCSKLITVENIILGIRIINETILDIRQIEETTCHIRHKLTYHGNRYTTNKSKK